MKLRVFSQFAALALSSTLAWGVDDQRLMSPDGRLMLVASAGRILIEGTAADRLEISAQETAPDTGLVISGDPDQWLIDLGAGGPGVYTIRVPETVTVEASLGDADLMLTGIRGPRLQLRSADGSIHIDHAGPRRLVVETVSGAVVIRGLDAREARLTSLAGRIEVSGLLQRLSLRTVSGPARLDLHAVEDLDTESLSGKVSARLVPQNDAVLRVRSQSGALTLELPPDTPLDLRAESHQGSISSAFGGQVESGQGSNRRLFHRSGTGMVRAELGSVDGPIEVLTRRASARALVFREPVDASAGRVMGMRRYRRPSDPITGEIRFGIDDEEKVVLRPGQFAEFDLPLDSRSVFAQQRGHPHPVVLEATQLEEALYCFRLSLAVRASDIPDMVGGRLGFELTHVPCPGPGKLQDYERIEVED